MLLIGFAVTPTVSHAAQSYDNCTGFITSIPATITTQGTWCLNADLNTAITSGKANKVVTNNVTIDCNDFKLGGSAAGAGTLASGIFAQSCDNLTIRRCSVRGFYSGTEINGGSGHLIEDNRFDGNTGLGISIGAGRAIIRRNIVIATSSANFNSLNYGIFAAGSVDVLKNTINGVTGSGTNNGVYGIGTDNNLNGRIGRISGNSVHGVVKVGRGVALCILNTNSDRITLRNNDVVGDGSAGSVGVRCASARGRALDNVVSGFVSGIQNCTNVGSSNDINP